MTTNEYILHEFGVFCAKLSIEIRESSDEIRKIIKKSLNESK